MRLHLDGICDLSLLLQHHGYFYNEDREEIEIQETKWFKARVFIRLTIPIHIALTLIRMTATQLLRGSVLFFGGITGLEKWKVVHGVNDIVSVFVQLAALPVLGIVICITPKGGFHKIIKLRNRIDVQRDEVVDERNILIERLDGEKTRLPLKIIRKIMDVVWGILGTPCALVTGITLTFQYLLAGDLEKAKDVAKSYASLALRSPFQGLVFCFAETHERVLLPYSISY